MSSSNQKTREQIDAGVQKDAEKAKLDKKFQEIAAKQKTWIEEQERKRQEKLERERKEKREKAEAAFEERMRRAFFGANPTAIEAEYQKARPVLREKLLVDDAVKADRELDEATCRYAAQGW